MNEKPETSGIAVAANVDGGAGVISRTGILLKIALVMLISLSARQLCVDNLERDGVARDGQISSTESVDATKSNLAGVSMTSTSARDDDSDDPVDLYGNEVTAAVAKYKLDGRGALYELHSPQTELPQLAPPRS